MIIHCCAMSSHEDVIQSWRFHWDISLTSSLLFLPLQNFLPSAEWHRAETAQSTAKLQMGLSHNTLPNMRLKASFSLLPSRERKISHFCGNPCECVAGKDILNTNLGCPVHGKRVWKLKDKCQSTFYEAVFLHWLEKNSKGQKTGVFQAERKAVYTTHQPIAREERGCIGVETVQWN